MRRRNAPQFATTSAPLSATRLARVNQNEMNGAAGLVANGHDSLRIVSTRGSQHRPPGGETYRHAIAKRAGLSTQGARRSDAMKERGLRSP